MAKAKILIVEDERVVAEDIKMRLERLGYTVSGIVFSREQAVKNAEETSPDLVLMDIVLEGEMDGIDAALAIRSRFNIPVVYLTAHADDKTLERAKVTEPFGYILKPYEDRELLSIIEIALYKHKMEKELKETQEWLSTMLKSISEAVIATDKKGNVTFMNHIAQALTGRKMEEGLGRPLKDVFNIINEETGEPAEDPVVKVLQEGDVTGLANHSLLIAKDEAEIAIDASGAPIKDERGNISGVVLAFRDITEHRQMRKTMEASKTSFHNIVEKSVDGIIIVDRDGIVHFVNPSAENIFGYKAKEIIGELFGFPVITDKSTEIDIIHSSGEPGTGEMLVVETEWEDEPAFLILIRDITERKQAEKIKDEFITTVSHEMRTPLSITKEAISLVLDKVHGEINEQQNRTLSIGKNNIDRLARIINSLLDISRIEAGKVELNKTKIDVAGTIETVVSSFESKVKEKNLELRIKFPGEGIYIYADEDRIVQVLSNLVDNAIKFTSEGFIEISAQENENAVEYTVADTGIGIPKEGLPNVFDKFKQFGRKEGPGEKGTGLGLSIVKSIVELHNGKIRVESTVGKGTKFIFSLSKWSSEEMLKQYLFDAIRNSKEKETHFSVIMISILSFKELIEDRPEKAKEILKKLEELIKNTLRRSSDTLIASNTGEILLILPETGRDDAISVLERIKEELRRYLSMEEDLKGKIDLSTGVISYPDEAKNEKDILNKIRQATYGQKILLIEDEPEQIEMIKGRLGAKSYQVIAAGNAEDGIKLAQKERPDLILMDMILPGMHGLEAVKKLKEIPETKEIPIIAFTAMSVTGFKQECFKEGICDFIRKPYESTELHEKIEKNIRKKHEGSDEIEDLEKKPEETLSEPDISIQKNHRPEIEKEKEKIEEKIEFVKLKSTLDEVDLKHEKKIPSEPAEGKKREEHKEAEMGKKILIIDDDLDLVKMLSIRLRACGYQVIAASDAVSGVKHAQKEKPNLIFLDIMMPGGGGDKVFENLKKSDGTMLIPIILISGLLPPNELKEKANKLGVEGAIAKPFESKEIISKIKEILGE